MPDPTEPRPQPIRYRDLDVPERRREALRVLLHVTSTWTVLAVVYFLAPLEGILGSGEVVRTLLSIVLLLMVSFWEIRSISRARIPQTRAIISLGTIAALLIVGFASIYLSLSRAQPGSFTENLDQIGALYFTITTLSSVGFGDIAPVTHTARIIASIQMLFDLILLGGIVRLLAMAARRSLDRPDRAAEGSQG